MNGQMTGGMNECMNGTGDRPPVSSKAVATEGAEGLLLPFLWQPPISLMATYPAYWDMRWLKKTGDLD